jgi:hypothetical protein
MASCAARGSAARLYAKGDLVLQGGIVYVCIVAHTAGVFATDLAAGDWGQVTANRHGIDHELLADLNDSSHHVQAAIAELDNECGRPIHS